MSKSFKLREPSENFHLLAPFGLSGQGVPIFECARLICGFANLEGKFNRESTKLRFCHVSQAKRRPSISTLKEIVDLLFDGELDVADAKRVFKKSSSDNKKFWEELRSEISFCLHWRRKGRFVEAFLHLYRILELISVALPLIYASRISDFREAVKFIKSLSKNDRDQDLSILRYFSAEISQKGTLSNLSFDFTFSNIDPVIHVELARQINGLVLSDKNIRGQIHVPISNGVEVHFSSVPSFVVSCRNRLFHNALSNDNFKLDALYGPETICKVVLDPVLYWFSFIFVEIIKTQAKRYV